MAGNSQVPIPFDLAPSMAREDLIETSSNHAAIALVDSWPDWHAPFAIVAGPPGSGKTHLCAIWAARSGAHRLTDPCRPGPSDLERAASGLPVVCDGLGFERLDEPALFHLLNAVRNAQGTMLISAASHPAQWPLRTADLKSRLASATATRLAAPDDDLLSAVAFKLFSDRQVTVDRSVVDYLIVRIERSLSAMAAIVDRLDRAALARKGRITRALAAEVLSDAPSRPDAAGL